VQWVNRPNAEFRGYAGRIAGSGVAVGDNVSILPSREKARIDRIVTYDGALARAEPGRSVTLTFDREVDCSRGDMIAAAGAEPEIGSRFEADLVWMSAEPLELGRSYLLKMGSRTVSAEVERMIGIVDVNSFEPRQASDFGLNDIGRCLVRLDRPLPLVPYEEERELGGFILIDRLGNSTVAAGMVRKVRPGARPTGSGAREAEIYWLSGIAPEERAEAAQGFRQRLRMTGARAVILGEEELALLEEDLGSAEGPERGRRLRAAARLLTKSGLDVIVAADADRSEAWPGRWIDAGEAAAQGAAEWVI